MEIGDLFSFMDCIGISMFHGAIKLVQNEHAQNARDWLNQNVMGI